jgi:hypothetical protein
MKMLLFISLILTAMCISTFAIGQSPVPGAVIIAASPAPMAVIAPLPSPSPQMVLVAPPSAPPQWAQDLISDAGSLPVVGPYVAKALLYAGILAAILTALVLFLLTVLSALSGVLHISGMDNWVAAIQNFKNGKFMYYLKYFSMFNAQKPPQA